MKKKIGIFGYGSQGRAHALNLRIGNEVLIANLKDKYSKITIKDKFKIHSFEYVAKRSDIVFFFCLITYIKKYEDIIINNLKSDLLLLLLTGILYILKKLKFLKNTTGFYLHQDYLVHLKENYI